jgi:hypothetical protein
MQMATIRLISRNIKACFVADRPDERSWLIVQTRDQVSGEDNVQVFFFCML